MKTGNSEIINSSLCVFDPVSGVLRVNISDTDKKIVLNIYDLTGSLKHRQIISSPVENINIAAFNKGIYLITIQAESSIVFREKIIKY
jgi:hypothetical protein